MLDLVPLAGARREVAHVDRESEGVGEPLQLSFPDARAIAVAAARIGGDEEVGGIGVALGAHAPPPRLDRCDGESGRVVVHADVDEGTVGDDVEHSVGDRLADGLVREVVDVDEVGLPLRLPLDPGVLEVADELLLLRVDGDDRIAC